MIDADTQTFTALLKERSGLSLTGDKQYLFEQNLFVNPGEELRSKKIDTLAQSKL